VRVPDGGQVGPDETREDLLKEIGIEQYILKDKVVVSSLQEKLFLFIPVVGPEEKRIKNEFPANLPSTYVLYSACAIA
jgi:hypothetical protein